MHSEVREIVEVRKTRWSLHGTILVCPAVFQSAREAATPIFVSGDERPEAHGGSGGGEGAAAGASERTGRADEHRALAGDQSHTGKGKAWVYCASLQMSSF